MREVEASILSRAPEHDLEPSLDRIRAVMELLGDPQRTFPVVHVTGTNGKTSTARIIEAILRELGLKTGRFTSPHLHSMLERIAVGGRPVDAERFLAAYDEVIPFVEMVDARSILDGGPPMTYFEVLVAVAYAAFADLPVDVAVVEVGMGDRGTRRTSSTAPVSVVTPIDLDHRHFLGDTVEEIASEKSGIIKADAITVVGLQQAPEAVEVLVERANDVGARIVFEGNDFGVTARDVAVGGQQISLRGLAGEYPDLFLPLHGTHQAQNAAVAVAAVEAFLGGGEQALDVDVVRAGLADRRLAGSARDRAAQPHRARRRRAQPGRGAGAARRHPGLVHLRPARRGGRRDEGQGGRREMLEALEPVLDEVVVTRTTSPRAMSPRQLGEIANGDLR